MRVPHWWSRDRSSCRHLWYPITGLRRNAPRIVHLPASVLENGASCPWRARASARTLDFRIYSRSPRRRQCRVRRPPKICIDPRGDERSIATTTGCPVQVTCLPLRVEECGVAERSEEPLFRMLSVTSLNNVHQEFRTQFDIE